MVRPFSVPKLKICTVSYSSHKKHKQILFKNLEKKNISTKLCYNLSVTGIACCADEPVRFHVPGTIGSFSLDNLICASCAESVSVQKKAQPVKAGAAKPRVYPEQSLRMTAGCQQQNPTPPLRLYARRGGFLHEKEK